MMKVQVTLPEHGYRQTKIVEIEIEQTEGGPIIRFKSLTGETLDSFLIHELLYSGKSFDEMYDHKCDDCEMEHCDDNNCKKLDKDEIDDKISRLKHTFHELENLLD